MSSEPDNLVLAQLRELRAHIDRRFEGIEQRFEGIERRMDKMDVNFGKALRSFVGHRNMAERAVADHDGELADLKRRVRRLEEAQA
jgi:hypothetical protein